MPVILLTQRLGTGIGNRKYLRIFSNHRFYRMSRNPKQLSDTPEVDNLALSGCNEFPLNRKKWIGICHQCYSVSDTDGIAYHIVKIISVVAAGYRGIQICTSDTLYCSQVYCGSRCCQIVKTIIAVKVQV